MEISVETQGALRKLERVQASVGRSIVTRFNTLGHMLRDELRSTIPRKTGKARRAIYRRIEAHDEREEVVLLVGGDLVLAPHLLYIEKGTKFQEAQRPIGEFQERNADRIFREVEKAVSDGVRGAGGNE